MSKRSFVKYHGLGNDFILIDDREGTFPIGEVSPLCHRKFGIGADGVILFQSPCRMRIFNSDGTEAESCGNGLRCFVLFLRELGIYKEVYSIQIGNRAVEAKMAGNQVAVNLGEPTGLRLHLATEIGAVHFVDTGVPHVVHFVPDVDVIDLPTTASRLRPLFAPRGANVNVAALQPDHSLRVRTYERGVEAETLACGTGAVAVAAVARKVYGLEGALQICFPGGSLVIDREWMIGEATRVFEGECSGFFPTEQSSIGSVVL